MALALPVCSRNSSLPPGFLLQNLEVLYRQYGRDGNKHGLDWQEVAVAIIQDGISVCDSSVLAASTVQVRGDGGARAGGRRGNGTLRTSACCPSTPSTALLGSVRAAPCTASQLLLCPPTHPIRPPTLQGFYSENMQQADAVGLPTSMHMFEYTAR